VIASGLAYVLYFTAIEILGAPRASSFLFLIPFVSLVGDFILGEPPYLIALIAGLIAIIGVALVKFSSNDVESKKVQS
ncbi:MAG: EamA family transporter, partial [Candidatus Thorarchaeota archaeon]